MCTLRDASCHQFSAPELNLLSFKYIFRPYYDIIELCNTSFFQGIPGLNLELKKEEYNEEYFTAFADLIGNRQIKFNENIFNVNV